MEEYEYDEDGNKGKISNIGDELGIQIYHTGVKDKKGKEISILIDNEGNSVIMTGGRELFRGGEKRDESVDYVTITDEFTEGYGPERSIFEGDHPVNETIQGMESYQDNKRKFDATNPNLSKQAYRVEWGVADVFTTADWQAQMMGTYISNYDELPEYAITPPESPDKKDTLILFKDNTYTSRSFGTDRYYLYKSCGTVYISLSSYTMPIKRKGIFNGKVIFELGDYYYEKIDLYKEYRDRGIPLEKVILADISGVMVYETSIPFEKFPQHYI